MRTKYIVLRAVFIGMAIVSGILWMVWMFDINAYTKFQILWGRVDMFMLRHILAGIFMFSICGVTATIHFAKKRNRLYAAGFFLIVYLIGLFIAIRNAPDTKYYTFHQGQRELIVMEEVLEDRHQAVFYERKNAAVVEYLGNLDYYGEGSAFESGNFDISWMEDNQVIVKVRAQFENRVTDQNADYNENYVETKETKSRIFYVEED